jgi:hypothetical protein
MDRIRIEMILGRLDDEIRAALATADPGPDAFLSIQAGCQLLEQEIGDDAEGPSLGLVLCAQALDILAARVARGDKPPAYFGDEAGETIIRLRSFRGRLDELVGEDAG